MMTMMKTSLKHSILTALLVALPSAAMAQRVPATDSGAIGGEVGLFIPREDGLSIGPTLEGFYEYYFSPRQSVRIGLGWAKPKNDNDERFAIRYLRVPIDIVYNWERGAVHPFVGAGLGIYFLQEEFEGDDTGDSETKLGGTLFGGVELFTNRTTSFKIEGRYHAISDIRGFDPDGVALTVGLKKYF
jgi:Outer membrane protein beta-barrel domain